MILGAAAFLAGYLLTGGVFITAGLLLGPARIDPLGELLANAAMAGYLVAVQAGFNASAFLAVGALSSRWRHLARLRRVVAAACLGVAAFLVNWLGVLWWWILIARPLATVVGAGHTVWLMFALPGLLAGVLAIALAPLLSART
jgi:membrane-associated HD superfamily phosphohydrolase